jgi:subtilase family serine protease
LLGVESFLAKLMKTKIGTVVVIAVFILVIGFPGFASTASAAQPENDWSAHPLIHVRPTSPAPSPAALTPTQIRNAYGLPSTGGAGTTIAIVDAYDDPTVQSDLTVFSTQYGLLPINFVEHKMASSIRADSGWALEISLDVQWAHAIAPNATILLVEARSNSLSDLLAAVNYAKSQPNVVAVSMSWGGSEFSTEASYDAYFSSSGITFFASSGDSGAGVIWPSTSSNVVAVGGTTLNLASGSVVETGWSGSGGGVSAYEPRPAYQTNFGLTSSRRAVPDVSYDADPNTGVPVYDSYGYSGQRGWFQVGGTSAGAPQWAAIQALGLTTSNNNFYQDAQSTAYASYFRDITSGSNGYQAGPGYDYVTGLGSPLTTNYTPTAPPQPPPPPPTNPDFTISASPTSLNVRTGSSGTSTITISSLNGFAGTVTLSASASSGLTVTFNPTQISGSGTSTMTVRASSYVRAGSYTITVKGTSGSLSHTTTVTVTVTRR